MLTINFYDAARKLLAHITYQSGAGYVPTAGMFVTIAIDKSVPAIEGYVMGVTCKYEATGCTVSVHLNPQNP